MFEFSAQSIFINSEALYDDEKFTNRPLAASVASKVITLQQLHIHISQSSGPISYRISMTNTRPTCAVCSFLFLLDQVFYHLEELDDALKYALGAGDLFDVAQKNEYVDTLIGE